MLVLSIATPDRRIALLRRRIAIRHLRIASPLLLITIRDLRIAILCLRIAIRYLRITIRCFRIAIRCFGIGLRYLRIAIRRLWIAFPRVCFPALEPLPKNVSVDFPSKTRGIKVSGALKVLDRFAGLSLLNTVRGWPVSLGAGSSRPHARTLNLSPWALARPLSRAPHHAESVK